MGSEVTVIWTGRMDTVKVLYFLSRYLFVAQVPIELAWDFLPNPTTSLCVENGYMGRCLLTSHWVSQLHRY